MFTPYGLVAVYRNTKDNVAMTANYRRMVDPWAAKKKTFLRAKLV